jgi:hypothetical protein
MKQTLDRFILSIPTLFIKQYPYAWIVAIALWSWPLNISAALFLIVAFGMVSLRWREAAWIAEMRRQHAPRNETFYVDRLPVPAPRAVRNIAILTAVSAATAWTLGGRLNLTQWQTFIMIFGFGLFYLDTRFFGAVTIYIVTGGGIATYYLPGHTDYRIFIHFKEMDGIARLTQIEKLSESWTLLSRGRMATSGVLLKPRDVRGFSRFLDGEVLLTPTNVDEFLKHVPSTLVMEKI